MQAQSGHAIRADVGLLKGIVSNGGYAFQTTNSAAVQGRSAWEGRIFPQFLVFGPSTTGHHRQGGFWARSPPDAGAQAVDADPEPNP